jgi:hypothetical protein
MTLSVIPQSVSPASVDRLLSLAVGRQTCIQPALPQAEIDQRRAGLPVRSVATKSPSRRAARLPLALMASGEATRPRALARVLVAADGRINR